jgi:hypothetical protein
VLTNIALPNYARLPIMAQSPWKALDAANVKESANLWRELFGDEFPAPPDDGGEEGTDDGGGSGKAGAFGGFTPRTEKTNIGGGRFA